MYNVINMTFGYQQGGSFSAHKQALGFDAAASEQMRLKQITEQRKKEQQQRAKQDVQSKKVKLRIVQNEINRRNLDLRRIESNIVRLSSEHGKVHGENHDLKIKELKNKIRDLEKEIEKEVSLKAYADKTASNQERELNVIQGRKKVEDAEIARLKNEEHQLLGEIKELEKVAL